MVQGSGLRIYSLGWGFRITVEGFRGGGGGGFRVGAYGVAWVEGLEFGVWSLGLRVQG
jgi:hypothetical protein